MEQQPAEKGDAEGSQKSYGHFKICYLGKNFLALNLSVFLVALDVTEEMFLVALAYEMRECLKDIFILWFGETSMKNKLLSRSLCDFAGPRARKVSRDFLVNWASTHSQWIEMRDLLNSKMNWSPQKTKQHFPFQRRQLCLYYYNSRLVEEGSAVTTVWSADEDWHWREEPRSG